MGAVLYLSMFADFHKLEFEGIDVTTASSQVCHFTGSLAVFSGDNLSSNSLGEFRCCFASGKYCRFCMIDYENMRGAFSNSDCHLCTERSTLRQSNLVVEDYDLSRVNGIMTKSCLFALNGINPIYVLVPDLIHDLILGVFPLLVKMLLRALIRDD